MFKSREKKAIGSMGDRRSPPSPLKNLQTSIFYAVESAGQGGLLAFFLRRFFATRGERLIGLLIVGSLVGFVWVFFNEFCLWRADVCLVLRSNQAAAAWLERSRWFAGREGAQATLIDLRIARRQGDFEKVERLLRDATKRNVPRVEIQRERWLAMAQTSQFAEMQTHWDSLLNDPRDDEPDILRSYYAWSVLRTDLPRAQQTLKMWRQNYPRDAEPWALSGHYYKSMLDPKWEFVVEAFREALKLEPNNLDYRLELANACAHLPARVEESLTLFQSVLIKDPDSRAAIRGLAELQLQRGEPDAALSTIQKLVARDTDDPALSRLYGEVLFAAAATAEDQEVRKRYLTESSSALERAYAAAPEDAKLAYLLALALRAVGRTSEAEPLFQFSAESQSEVSRLRSLEEELERRPGNIELHIQIAEIIEKYVSRQDAIRWYQNVLRISPNCHPANAALRRLQQQVPGSNRGGN